MQNFKKYLNYVHEHFVKTVNLHVSDSGTQAHPLNVVMGNESCDLDSNMGSLSLAYLLSLERTDYDLFNESKRDQLYVPILSFDREIYAKAKFENLHYLAEYFDITLTNTQLVFYHDHAEALASFLETRKAHVVLFDHNEVDVDALSQNGNWEVQYIYDHHKPADSFAYKGEHQIVTPLGSATTLVAAKLQKVYKSHSDSEHPDKNWFDQKFLQFVSGPIIHDTQDFKDKIKGSVWTDLDESSFHFLKKHSEHIDKPFRKFIKKYKDYIGEQNASLDLYYNLRRDFKSYPFVYKGERVLLGFSTVVMDIDAKFQAETQKENGLQAVAGQLDQLFNKSGIQVEILKSGSYFVLVAKLAGTELLEFVAAHMEGWAEKSFKRTEFNLKYEGWTLVALQAEGGVKRKELVPFLNKMFK